MEGTVSTDRQQDAGLDRLVRAALRGDTPPEGEVCPNADVVAAYAAGALSARERTELEPHLATCQRCQAVIALVAADAEADAINPHVAAVPKTRRSWFRMPRLAWLVPAGAATLALVLYVATRQDATSLAPQAGSTQAAAGAPEQTLARAADTAERQAASAAKSEDEAPRTRTSGRAAPAPSAANELKTSRPAKTDSTLALAEQVAPAAPPSSQPAAPAAAAGNFALAAPAEARQKAAAPAEALDNGAVDLDALWRRSEIVVVGRPAPPEFPSDKDRAVANRSIAAAPGAGIVVLESLKQPADAAMDRRLTVTPAPAPAGASRLDAGIDTVYFLTRVKGADGTTRLVTMGAVSLDAAHRDDTLARLRRLAARK
jgi:hypothetical protein